MNIGDIGMWCLRHLLLLWGGLFLLANLWGFLLLGPSGMDGLPSPLLLVIYITSAVFFFVYGALHALGIPEPGSVLPVTAAVVIFVIFVALDFAVGRMLRQRGADGPPSKTYAPAAGAGRFLLRHAILVWGVLQFLSGLAVVAMDLQYDAGGLETLAFFFFWFLGIPTLVGQWLLLNLGADFAPTTWPYASLLAGFVLCIVADALVNLLLKRARDRTVPSSTDAN